jgi:hypothetical protein
MFFLAGVLVRNSKVGEKAVRLHSFYTVPLGYATGTQVSKSADTGVRATSLASRQLAG